MTEQKIKSLVLMYNDRQITLETLINTLIHEQRKEYNMGVTIFLIDQLQKRIRKNEKIKINYNTDNNGIVVVTDKTNQLIFSLNKEIGIDSLCKNETGVFKEDTEYIEEIIFNRTRVGGRDNNLYRITSIANCVIGQNEIYQFKNLKEVQNNSKYTYCLFNKDGKLIEKCLVNKVKKYIYYRYIDNNNDDVEKIYTISRLSDKELYEKGSDYILKNGSWTSNLISIKKKKTRKELITRFKIFGAAIVLVAGCKFVKENNKYKKTISGQSIESVIDEILEMTSDDIYTLENYIKTEKLIDEYNLPNVEEFDLNETEKQREKTKNNL